MTMLLSLTFISCALALTFWVGITPTVLCFPVSVGSHCLEFSFILDSMSLSGVCLVLFISFCVFMFSHSYMSGDHNNVRFILILAGFVLSMLFLLVSNSIPSLLMGWDGLGVTSFLLIVYYDSKTNNRSGLITFCINRFGDAVLIGTLIFFLSEGNMSMGVLFGVLLSVSYCVVAMTKSAQYPFSMWLPLAMDAPTPVSALVHSSTLVTAGLFLLARLSPESLNVYLSIVGGVTLCVGGYCAVFSSDLKKLIANSTLSNLGLMMFVLSICNKSLMLFHLFSHALFKAGLFITAGAMLMNSFGAQDSRTLYGGAKNSPILGSLLSVFFISSMGLFFTSAFFSKHQIVLLVQSGNSNFLVMGCVLLGVAFTALYSLRFTYIILSDKMHISISSEIPSLVKLSIAILGGSSVLYGNFACSNMLLSGFSFEIPLNEIVILSGAFFLILSNSLSSNQSVSMLQMDTTMDAFTSMSWSMRGFQLTDLGYGSPESKNLMESIQGLGGSMSGTLSSSRVNLTMLCISGCLMLLFM